MDSIAISVKNVSKEFTIPHEKINTVKGAFLNAFRGKTYETFFALNGISFDVQHGECFGIIGKNGSGKSTLLKILSGIYQPDTGSISVKGAVVSFLELGVGFNFELSGRSNIYFNGILLGLSRSKLDRIFDEIVAFSELERFIDQKLKNYSSGMIMRLAFSIAIHVESDILILDEVLAVGDADFQKKCFGEFERYKRSGKTILLVSHDMGVIREHCNRVLFIENGGISAIGDPHLVEEAYMHCNNA